MAAARAERPFDAARLQQSVRDVAAWVEVQRVQTWRRGFLRDPRLRPFPADEYWPDRPRAVMTAAVDALVARRRALLADAVPGAPTNDRLLACEWNNSMWDNLTHNETEGLFDQGDLPPWDLWVDVLAADDANYDLLLAWIPEPLVQLAEEGIDCNCTGLLYWCRPGPPGSPPVRIPD